MIACENLTKRFGHFTAVDHVSFTISKGSIFGFLGPNGSGKSTVIRMLCGLLEPSEGRASIGGFGAGPGSDLVKKLVGCKCPKFSPFHALTMPPKLQFFWRPYLLRAAPLVRRPPALL